MPYIKLDSKSFSHNLHTIVSQTNSTINNIAIVLKDNAYGHGLIEMATLANKYGITSCFVKSEVEAHSIKHLFKHITILYPNFDNATEDNMYISITSLESLKKIQNNKTIELKIDSGMHRNGISKDEIKEAIKIIKSKNLRLFGVFTHNGFADEIGSEFYGQFHYFTEIKKEIIKLCKDNQIQIPRFHSLASSGAFRGASLNSSLPQELQDSIFRIGIALYGYCTSEIYNIKLKPVASLWAKKISSKTLKKGSTIGYGGVSKLDRDLTISTYDIGYGDGLFRIKKDINLTTKEGFSIFQVASMDCISIESTLDEVCIFDDATTWTSAFSTIPYEILSHLHANIPKKIV